VVDNFVVLIRTNEVDAIYEYGEARLDEHCSSPRKSAIMDWCLVTSTGKHHCDAGIVLSLFATSFSHFFV